VPSQPKALIFDLGGVIVPLDFHQAYSRMEPLCGYPAAEIPKRIGATDLVRRFECGQIEPEPFARELLQLVGMPAMTTAEFTDLWSWIFGTGSILPESLFRSLRRQYRLVLLSNTNVLHFELLSRRYPLLDLFHEKVLSYEVGAMKPSPLIYREAIARAGCRPDECFFTDDVLPYVDAARTAGIDAVQFTGREQLEAELHLRGIRWESVL
jgi:FMN phosphatase YigB (HAD superfamily)